MTQAQAYQECAALSLGLANAASVVVHANVGREAYGTHYHGITAFSTATGERIVASVCPHQHRSQAVARRCLVKARKAASRQLREILDGATLVQLDQIQIYAGSIGVIVSPAAKKE